METIHGASSFILRTVEVELAVTQTAGHLGPVTFNLPNFKAKPYSLSPWLPTQVESSLPPLLAYLRGDFLCLPFGGQQNGPPHGDTANATWKLTQTSPTSLELYQHATDTGATVKKRLTLIPGHHAIYCEHLIENLEGRWNYGNHPILDLSNLPEAGSRIATSAFYFGSVYPGEFSNSPAGESGILKPYGEFTSLKSVPMKDGTMTDLSQYPARRGNDDLVMFVHNPATDSQPFAWTAVTFPNYIWFSLKNVADFPSTLLWLSNGGRTAHPWEGRHLGRLGVEDVCSHFCDGVDVAREDRLAAKGITTSRLFHKAHSVRLPQIHATTAVEANFGQVKSIIPSGSNSIQITGELGQSIIVPIHWQYLKS